MDRYSSIKEEIKGVCDIVELIGQFVQLKKTGKNYVGLCPFHSEKDPSFTVNPERQIFHCFGCKKGGDIFTFWMEYHNVSFFEALKDIAERYNIDIKGLSGDKGEERAKLLEINEMAASFYRQMLYDPVEGKKAREYLRKRNIDDAVAKEAGLGYAPDRWDSLYKLFLNRHIDIRLAINAGLLVERDAGDGCYDRFRNRLIFPIFDIRGRVVGFGGRVLGDGMPKYLNTPETPVFHKGSLLYGINFSYKDIRDKKEVIIIEGYMDWIALRKYGIKNAAATLGTALTPNHVRRLKGYADEAIVVFDSDEAGKKAALRSFPLFANEGMPARVVILPDGHDPDSFLNEKGRDAFLGLLDNVSRPMLDFYLDMEIGDGRIKDEKKTSVLKSILANLSFIKDSVTKGVYVSKISERLGIREDIIWDELQGVSKRSVTRIGQKIKEEKSIKIIGDLQILSLILFHPDTIPVLIRCNAEKILSDPSIREIVNTIFQRHMDGEDISPEVIHDVLEDEEAKALLREFLQRPFIVYGEEEVEQAVSEIEKKARKKSFLHLLREKKGDIRGQNELIKNLRGGL